MSEKTSFSEEKVERSELERLRENLSNYQVPVSVGVAKAIKVILERYLKAGLVTFEDMQGLVDIHTQLDNGLAEWTKFQERTNIRLRELVDLENKKIQLEISKRELEKEQILTEERQRRKKLQQELDMLRRNRDAQTRIESVQPQTVAEDLKPLNPSRAFDIARSVNPDGTTTATESNTNTRAPKPAEKVESVPTITSSNATRVSMLEEPPKMVTEETPTEEAPVEELVVPNRKELERMTKSAIKEKADELEFTVSEEDTKKVMIDSFIKQTEDLISNLGSNGELVNVDYGDVNAKNVADGGTF